MKTKKMNINKKYLLIRILTFPIKLAFTLFWNNLIALMLTWQWILHGGQELYYGKDNDASLVKLIEQNEEIIKKLKL